MDYELVSPRLDFGILILLAANSAQRHLEIRIQNASLALSQPMSPFMISAL